MNIKDKYTIVLVSIFLGISLCIDSMSQEVFKVEGYVYDELKSPLPGATVTVKGSNVGVVTDANGFFVVNSEPTSILTVSFIGYDSMDIPVNKRSHIEVILEESTVLLEEVSVIGYGTQKKAHLTGSVANIDTEYFSDFATSDISTMLQGSIPGLVVENTTAEVGVEPFISIRGISSLNTSNQPLIVVDGAPMADAFQLLNPQDIQSIDVLKDASSTAIYGSRGSNGVIIITTKEGVINKPTYRVRAYAGIKSPYKLRDMMNYSEYVAKLRRENELKGFGSIHSQYLSGEWLEAQMGATNWNEMLFRENAITNNVDFSMSGGKPGIKYLLSLAYIRENGLMLYNNNDRFTARTRTDIDISKNISLTANLTLSYREYTRPSRTYDDFATYPAWLPAVHNEFSSAFTGLPVGSYASGRDFNIPTPVYPVGPIDSETGLPTLIGANPYNTINNNPLQILNSDLRRGEVYSLNGSLNLKANITPDLTFNSMANLRVTYSPYYRYVYRNATRDGETNHGYFTSRLYKYLLSENTLTYTKRIEDHNLDILGGFTAEKIQNHRSYMHAIDFPTDDIHTLNAATAYMVMSTSGRSETGTTEDSQTLTSFIGRVNYNYKERYLLSLAARADGSSLLGEGNKWGYFPSLSLGWIASEEEFLKSQNWLSNLKFRVSGGVSGNNAIENYATMNLLSTAMYSFGEGAGSIHPGLANTSSTLANQYLKWEQTEELNAGIDFSILKNKLSLTVDAYSTVTRSLLFKRPIQTFTGFSESWENIGKIQNRGLEATLAYNYRKKKFSWNSSVVFFLNRNKLLQLGGEERIIHQGITNELYINIVGQPISQFYGYKTDGVWLSQEEIDNSPHFTTGIDQPGTLKVIDINGDGVINENDYTVLGDPYPNFNFGFNNSFKLGDFDLSINIEGVVGSSIYNSDLTRNHYQIRDKGYNTEHKYISEEYPGDGKTPTFYGIQWILTDYAIEDNSHLALRNITLGYNLPGSLRKKFNLGRLRVYLTGDNLFYLWSKNYRGVNPESQVRSGVYSSALVYGYQRGSYPINIGGTIGIDIIF